MLWYYRCPSCGRELDIDWDFHREEAICNHCHQRHYPPTPGEDHTAYFSGDRWPPEMTDAVISLRGTTCSVPGCFQNYTTLAHRRPLAEGGRTSVENLIPLCAEHARLKGLRNYDEWIQELPSAAPAKTVEITITHHQKEPTETRLLRNSGNLRHLVGLARPDLLSPELHPVIATPFIPGTSRRLLFHYQWRLHTETGFRVVLVAWPRFSAEMASPSLRQVENIHQGKRGDSGRNLLELHLEGELDNMWVAVVACDHGDKDLLLEEYLLSLAD